MKSIAVSGILSVFFVASALEAQAPGLPDPQLFQSALARTEQALEQRDIEAIWDAGLDLYRQVVRMPDSDDRLPSAMRVFPDVINIVGQSVSQAEIVDYLEELNGLAEEVDRHRNGAAWATVVTLYETMFSSGDIGGAADLLRDVIEREEELAGSEHSPVRMARTLLIETSVATGDAEEALEELDEFLESTVELYGEGADETAEILTSMARAHLSQGDYAQAIARADEAAPIVMKGAVIHARLTEKLGRVYVGTSQLEKARDMFQVAETLIASGLLDSDNLLWAAQANLAELNARLGDGAAARRYLNMASELSRLPLIGSTEIRTRSMRLEASIFTLAGMFDEAQAVIGGIEDYGESESIMGRPEYRANLAYDYLHAMAPDRAAELATDVMDLVDSDSDLYASAATALVIASALLEPPVSRLELAEDLLDRAERRDRESPHLYERYGVALALAAEGDWEQSAAMQKDIIDTEAAQTSRHATNPLQWETYAMALDRLGRSDEHAELLADLERSRASLREALTGQTASNVFVEERSGFGFDVSLEDAGWQRMRGGNFNIPSAAFAAAYSVPPRPYGGMLFVIPVLLPQGIGAQTIIDAYSGRIAAGLDDLEPWTDGPLQGFEARIEGRSPSGEEVVQSVRIFVEPSAVYIVGASARSSEPESIAAAEAALDRVTIRRGATVDDLSADELEQHGRIMHFAGNGAYGAERFEEARALYREAASYYDDYDVTKNLAFAHFFLEEFDAVIETVNAHESRFGPDGELLMVRAEAYANTSQYQRSITDYATAFEMGTTSNRGASNYVRLLVALGRGNDAADFLDDYSVDNDDIEIHALHAMAGYAIGDEDRVDDALSVLTDPGRSNPQAAIVAATIVADRDVYAIFRRLTNQLVDDGLGSEDLYAFRADFELRTGRYNEAEETISAGLDAYPRSRQLQSLQRNVISN